MPRPWIEGAVLLAFVDHDAAPLKPQNPIARSLIMADKPDFAFLPRIDAVTRPIVCPDLAALARHIERGRGHQNMQLIDVEDIEYDGELHRGVKVMLLDMANDPERCLGFAWLRGRGREVLEPALFAARRTADQAARDRREAA